MLKYLLIGGYQYDISKLQDYCKTLELFRLQLRERVVDFQLAQSEILQKQEEKLREKLDEEKRTVLSQLQLERIENERNFKKKMDMLELEELKFKCNKEILETERKAFEENNSLCFAEIVPTPTHKSTLLDDIHRIMQEPSSESLHKTKLMIKEATQLCKSFGLNFEFKHLQVMDDFGIFRTIIIILDKENNKKAEWPIARLSVWLDIARNCEKVENIFSSVDIEWLPCEYDVDKSLNESLNSSGIGLNINVAKNSILKATKPNFKMTFTPHKTETKNPKSKEDTIQIKKSSSQNNKCLTELPDCKWSYSATAAVQDIESSILRLKKFCDYYGDSDEFSNEPIEACFRKSVPKLEAIVKEMYLCLDRQNPHCESTIPIL